MDLKIFKNLEKIQILQLLLYEYDLLSICLFELLTVFP